MFIVKAIQNPVSVLATQKVFYKKSMVLAIAKGKYIILYNLDMEEIEQIYLNKVVRHIIPIGEVFICLTDDNYLLYFSSNEIQSFSFEVNVSEIYRVIPAEKYFFFLTNDKILYVCYVFPKIYLVDKETSIFCGLKVIDVVVHNEICYVLHNNDTDYRKLSVYKHASQKFNLLESLSVENIYKIFFLNNNLLLFDLKKIYILKKSLASDYYKENKNMLDLNGNISKNGEYVDKKTKSRAEKKQIRHYEMISEFKNKKINGFLSFLGISLVYCDNKEILIIREDYKCIKLGYLDYLCQNFVHLRDFKFFASGKNEGSLYFRIKNDCIFGLESYYNEKEQIFKDLNAKFGVIEHRKLEQIYPSSFESKKMVIENEQDSHKFNKKTKYSLNYDGSSNFDFKEQLNLIDENPNIEIIKKYNGCLIGGPIFYKKDILSCIGDESKVIRFFSSADFIKEMILETETPIKRIFFHVNSLCVVVEGKTYFYDLDSKKLIKELETELIDADVIKTKSKENKKAYRRLFRNDGFWLKREFIKTEFEISFKCFYKDIVLLYGKINRNNFFSLYQADTLIKTMKTSYNVSFMLIDRKRIYISTFDDEFIILNYHLKVEKEIKFETFMFGTILCDENNIKRPHFLTSRGKIYKYENNLYCVYSTSTKTMGILKINENLILITGKNSYIFDSKMKCLYNISIGKVNTMCFFEKNLFVARKNKIYKISSNFISICKFKTKEYKRRIRFFIELGNRKIIGTSKISVKKGKNTYLSKIKIVCGTNGKKIKHKIKDCLLMDAKMLTTDIIIIGLNFIKNNTSKLTAFDLNKPKLFLFEALFDESLIKLKTEKNIIILTFTSEVRVLMLVKSNIFEIFKINNLSLPKCELFCSERVLELYICDKIKGMSVYEFNLNNNAVIKTIQSTFTPVLIEKFDNNTLILASDACTICIYDKRQNVIIEEIYVHEKIIDMVVGLCTQFRDRKCVYFVTEVGTLCMLTSLKGILQKTDYYKLIKMQNDQFIKKWQSSKLLNYINMEVFEKINVKRIEKQNSFDNNENFENILRKLNEIC